MKSQFLAMAATATLVGSIRVVMAGDVNGVNPQVPPADVCYDDVGNTRFVKLSEPCKPNEKRSTMIPQKSPDPADDPQAQLQNQIAVLQTQFQKQVADLSAKVSALQAQLNQVQNDQNKSDKPDPDPSIWHDAKTGKPVDHSLQPDEGDPSRPDNQVHMMPGQKVPGQKNPSNPRNPGNPGTPTRVTAPFQVVDAAGNVIVDVEAGDGADGFRGLRAYAMNRSYAQLGARDAAFYANVSVHKPGDSRARTSMGILADGRPVITILGTGGADLSAEMTEINGNGEMRLYNPSGQINAKIGSNPTNSEGHAVFTDAGGNPQAEIGAAGKHGDVLIGNGGSKALALWEMILTGFH